MLLKNIEKEQIKILNKVIHGGFVHRDKFTDKQIKHCSNTDWIEECYKYTCIECGDYHTTNNIDDVRCVRRGIEIEPRNNSQGYRLNDFKISTELKLTVKIVENTMLVNISEEDKQTIIFTPDTEEILHPDVGIVICPIKLLSKTKGDILQKITETDKWDYWNREEI